MLSANRLRGNYQKILTCGPRASGCFRAPTKNPHEMGSKKGNVKIRRKVRRPQAEKIGSSGWIRTSNPPVNRLTQVHYLVGSSGVSLGWEPTVTRCSASN